MDQVREVVAVFSRDPVFFKWSSIIKGLSKVGDSNSVWTGKPLVAGANKGIRTYLFNIEWPRPYGLRAINNESCTDSLRFFADRVEVKTETIRPVQLWNNYDCGVLVNCIN